MSRRIRWILAGVAVLVVLAIGGPFVYIHFFNQAPAALTLPAASASASGTATADPAASPSSVSGTWTITSGSVVGYRVNEVLLGQNTTAVGRSSDVTGHLTIDGTTVTAATFSVPMDTIHSDKSQRDAQFDGRIMNVSQYPTGTFTLAAPITLKGDAQESYTAHGHLTLHGTTEAVTFTLQAELKSGQVEVLGDIPVLFSDYNIQNPSFAGFVTTQDHGILEFLLVLKQ
jgi:polyisoprenoid-binding protein YceI